MVVQQVTVEDNPNQGRTKWNNNDVDQDNRLFLIETGERRRILLLADPPDPDEVNEYIEASTGIHRYWTGTGWGAVTAAAAPHDHDSLYYRETEADARFVLVSGHTKALHDALLIDAGTLDGFDSTAFVLQTQKGVAGGVAPLDSSNLVPTAHIPPLAISQVFEVSTQAAMLALTAQTGDMAIRTDFEPDRVYFLIANDPTQLANWKRVTFGDVVSVNGQVGVITLTYTDVGAAP